MIRGAHGRPPSDPGADPAGALAVVLVEDSPDHAELAIRSFKSSPFPFEVSSHRTVAEAETAIATLEPDLIVADIRLPDGNGADLLMGPDGLRPLVLITSFGGEQQAVQAIKAGALDYVVKSEESFDALPDICRRAVRDWRAEVEKERARQALAASESRYRTLVENVPAGVFQFECDGQLMDVNPAMARLLGYEVTYPFGQLNLFRDLLAGGAERPASAADLDGSGTASALELEVIRADGSIAVVLMTTRVLIENDKECCYEGFCIDVTERRKADKALRETRLRFEATFRDSYGFMAIVDPAGRVTDVNRSALRVAGCALADVAGMYLWEMPWWQDVEGEPGATRTGLEKALAGEAHHDQSVFRSAEGHLHVGDRSFSPVFDQAGQLKFIVVEGRDVTELVEASRRIEQSERQFRALFENAPEAVVVLDVERQRFVDVNSNAEELFGAPKEALVAMGPAELSPNVQPGGGLSSELISQFVQAAIAGQKPVFEWTHRTVTGKKVACEVRLIRLPDRKRLLVRGSVTDISRRKQAEANLRESQQRMSSLVENAGAGILEIDGEGKIISANPAAVGMLGYNQMSEMQGQSYLTHVSSADREAVARALQGAISGHDASCKYRVDASTAERILSSSFVALRAGDGAISRVMVMSDDVTDRERSEARLHAEKEFTETVINSLPGIFYVIDERRRLVRWNENFLQITGRSSREFPTLDPRSLFVEEDQVAMASELDRVLNEGEGKIEARLIAEGGRRIPFLLTGRRLLTANGVFIIGMGFDISQRKHFEAQLRASENYLRSVIESEPECVWTLDRGARLKEINPAGRQLLGEKTVAFAEKESIMELVAPEHRSAFRQLNDSVFAGRSGILTFRMTTRAGDQRWLETHAVALRDESGKIDEHLAVTRDVTAKRAAEHKIGEYSSRLQALSQRLLDAQEAERRHMARELHDEVGQSLTALKLDLEAAGQDAGKRSDHLLDSLRIVERILDQVRGMSLDLRPAILDDLGLLPALRWYTDRQGARSGVKISLRAESMTGVRLATAIETASFRIVQEALTNVIRHAEATRADVLLELESERLWIHVRDNGRGFDSRSALRSSYGGESFGLLGLQERAVLMGGQVEISSDVGKGTEVVGWLPLAALENSTPDKSAAEAADFRAGHARRARGAS